MRILAITAQKPDSTGSGVFLAQTVRCLVQAGHEVAVVCGVGPADDPACALPDDVLVRPVVFETPALPFPVCGMSDAMPYAATRYRDLTDEMAERFETAFSKAFVEVDEAFSPDVVVCHHLYLATAIARRALPHRRMAAVCHSTDLRQLGQHDLRREFIVSAIGDLDIVLALHEAQKEEIVRVFGVDPARVVVIGTGYDSRVFYRAKAAIASDARPRRSAGGSPAELDRASVPRVLYVGKIWEKKGVLSLLEAIDILAARGIAVEMDLVGGYSSREEYERVTRRAQSCAVAPRFLGTMPPSELADRYRASDVFVLPSFFEGLPLVAIEALACGCRVVMTDLPGLRPWISEFLPDAPIEWVAPPAMEDVDMPRAEDLPGFSQRLADALHAACAAEPRTCDTAGLSWERLTQRMCAAVCGGDPGDGARCGKPGNGSLGEGGAR